LKTGHLKIGKITADIQTRRRWLPQKGVRIQT
jgi:hypothetical protein